MSLQTRLIRLEESSPTATLPRIVGVWLIPVEPEAAAVARYCADRGLEKLPAGVSPQFISWLPPGEEGPTDA
jgi:hypothetical protein